MGSLLTRTAARITLACAATGLASAQLGTTYCTANINSTGGISLIAATGSTDVVANDVTLSCSALPTNSYGFFIVSRDQGYVTNPGGSAGNLCVSGSIGRYSLFILNSGGSGAVSLPIDLTSIPHPTMPFAVIAGDTLNFQYWHRDAAVGGGATSNFSQGLEVGFSTAPPTPSFLNDVYPLFEAINGAGVSCTSCHGGTCNLNLDTAPIAYAALINVPALCCPGDTYVIPGDALGSLIYQKLTGPNCGSAMPLIGTFPGDPNIIRDWINGGAPNN